MSPESYLNKNAATSASLMQIIRPDRYEEFWLAREICHGSEHDEIHHLMVFGLTAYIAKDILIRNKNTSHPKFEPKQIDFLALFAASILHDTQRIDENNDQHHGFRAENKLNELLVKTDSHFLFKNLLGEPETIELTANILKYHLLQTDSLPEEIRNNLTFQIFTFCDVLAMVRYNFWDEKFVVTPEMLQECLPNVYSYGQLQQLIRATRVWHENSQIYHRTQNLSRLESVIKAGIEAGFLTD